MGVPLKALLIEKELKYDGTQLSSHFAYRNFGLAGDSIVAFRGSVEVNLTEMVDIEDVINKEPIASDGMLSFIIEVFDQTLAGMVCLQRLFTAILQDELNSRLLQLAVSRSGDDLFFKGRKLSVSIATVSPLSAMIHMALNIKPTGAPVSISCLDEMGIDWHDFAEKILAKLTEEYESMQFARVKVNWIK
jgi:uncharacterized protein